MSLPNACGQPDNCSIPTLHWCPEVETRECRILGGLCEDSRWHLFFPYWQVLYRWSRQSSTSVIETNKTSVELSLPFDEDYIIEIKPFSDGGDGSSSEQIRIPKISSKNACLSFFFPLPSPCLPYCLSLPVSQSSDEIKHEKKKTW